ncbi:MAG: tetratricopeptide repeat protein [Pyrinomonadaceae bacterium]|nr:tetratricopeptide repeat protein [Pyrinomonadaceae bacterium]
MMNSSGKITYRFADVEVDLSRGSLTHNGKDIYLRQKTFQVFIYLLEQHDRLVSKDELMQTVWKDTAVTDDVLVQCVKEIRQTLGDNPQQPRFIKTFPKIGYRFIGKVEEYPQTTFIEEITKVEFEIEEEFDTDQSNKKNLLPIKDKKSKSFFYFPIAIVVLIGILIFGVSFWWRTNLHTIQTRLPIVAGKKNIAVMFFENHSKSVELDWLREGLADMLITNLSRSNNLNVLSRNQLYNLLERQSLEKNFSLDQAVEIARQTQSNLFILGSFSQIGERVRLDIQIYDAESGNILTSENLTVEKSEQLLTEIDLLSFKITNRLNIDSDEKANLATTMTNNLEAYRYYSLALEKAQGLQTNDALDLLEKAVALDPSFAMAYARIGHTYSITQGWSEKGKPYLEKAFAMSDRLSEKDRLFIAGWYAIANLDYPSAIQTFREIIQKYPTETEAYLRLGYLLRGEEKFEDAIGILRQGLAIDSNSPEIYNALGLLYSLLGKHSEAIVMHEHYVALEPSKANSFDSLGMTYQWAGHYNEAIVNYQQALKINPKFEIAQVHLGNTYFQSGQFQKSIEAIKKYIELAPSHLERGRGFTYLAYIYRKQNNLNAAKQAAQTALNEEPFQMGEMLIISCDNGDWKTVEKLKNKIFADASFSNRGARLSPRYKYYYLGYIALKKGETETALENFREALRHLPLSWNIDSFEDCLANAYLEIGRYDEAIAEYQRILQINPNYPFAQYSMAKALEKKGQLEDSQIAYRKFLESWKNADQNISEIIQAQKSISS